MSLLTIVSNKVTMETIENVAKRQDLINRIEILLCLQSMFIYGQI